MPIEVTPTRRAPTSASTVRSRPPDVPASCRGSRSVAQLPSRVGARCCRRCSWRVAAGPRDPPAGPRRPAPPRPELGADPVARGNPRGTDGRHETPTKHAEPSADIASLWLARGATALISFPLLWSGRRRGASDRRDRRPCQSICPVMRRASSSRASSSGGSTFFSRQSSRTVLPVLTDSLAIAAAAS